MILREGLLDGLRAGVVAAPEVAGRLAELGALVRAVEPAEDAEAVEPLDLLVVGAPPEPVSALDGAWLAIRSAAIGPMTGTGGQIQLLAPRPGDAHAQAARAGLENLARTLSVEWARFGVRPVAILPGASTTPQEVAELSAFLASEAGAYYSGCAFTLA